MDDDILTPEDKAELSEAAAKRLEFSTVTIGLILFMIGIAVGFPLAVIGTSFLTENAGILVSIILTLAGVIALMGTLILLFRRRILQFLFNVSATQLELFSRPLSETARSIMDKNPASAINSAEELTRLLLARWTWISTRRWLIGSLTGTDRIPGRPGRGRRSCSARTSSSPSRRPGWNSRTTSLSPRSNSARPSAPPASCRGFWKSATSYPRKPRP